LTKECRAISKLAIATRNREVQIRDSKAKIAVAHNGPSFVLDVTGITISEFKLRLSLSIISDLGLHATLRQAEHNISIIHGNIGLRAPDYTGNVSDASADYITNIGEVIYEKRPRE
jgi:hypothetical protein